VDSIGMDVHTRESQVCIVDGDGTIVVEQRIRTERGRFAAVFGARAPAKILLEASTESEWVAQGLCTRTARAARTHRPRSAPARSPREDAVSKPRDRDGDGASSIWGMSV